MDYLLMLAFILILISKNYICEDFLVLLSATLRTYHQTACDTDRISLKCPRGTNITIAIAQYEKNNDGMEYNICPTDDMLTTQKKTPDMKFKHLESCHRPKTLQYSLMRRVIDACQKKTYCQFLPLPKSIGDNSCPGIRVEFEYKCLPYEFKSMVVCENDVVQLACNPYSRIAVFSAKYGRTEHESIQCSQPKGVKEETCLASYATETVMKICHGKRRCLLSANTATFGSPCNSDSRMYLKLVYTCVRQKVLKEDYDIPQESDEPIRPAPKFRGETKQITGNFDKGFVQETAVITTTSISSNNSSSNLDELLFEQNYELLYYYIFLAITLIILVSVILIVIARIIILKRNHNNDVNNHEIKSQISNSIIPIRNDLEYMSEENDFDLTRPVSIISSITSDDPMCTNTYTAGAYGNLLEPGNNSYGLLSSNLNIHRTPTVLRPANELLAPTPNLRSGSTFTFLNKQTTTEIDEIGTINRQTYQ